MFISNDVKTYSLIIWGQNARVNEIILRLTEKINISKEDKVNY